MAETKMILFMAISSIFMKHLMIEGKPAPTVDCNTRDCTNVPKKPVCGERDGSMLTFDNRCELELEKCQTADITFVQEGECKEKCKDVECPKGQSCIYDQDGFSYCINTNCDEAMSKKCPTDEKKVCGLNNITYDSECHLEQEACKIHQVLLKRYDGTCEEKKTCADTVCGSGESCVTAKDGTPRCIECCKEKKDTKYKVPMCGSDGRTYSSWCEMRAESCRTGCKSFFKRSIQRQIKYNCRHFQHCVIDRNHRNQCQYCRFKQCLRVGMKKEAVQKGRLLKSPLEGSVIGDHVIGFHSNHHQQQHQYHEVNEHRLNNHLAYYANLLRKNEHFSRSHHQQQYLVNQQQQQQQRQQENHQHQYINNQQSQTQQTTDNNQQKQTAINFPVKILINCVEWAKSLPLFNDLPRSDQIALLCSSWSKLYILTSSQYACASQQPISAKTLSRLTNQHHRQPNSANHEDSIKTFDELVEKFIFLRTDLTEFSCLKALVLFNPDIAGISNALLIEKLQEKVQTTLEDYLPQNTCDHLSSRYGKLLLRLPALSLLRADTIESILFTGLLGNVSVANFVISLLTTNAPFSISNTTNHNADSRFPFSAQHASSLNININMEQEQSLINNRTVSNIIQDIQMNNVPPNGYQNPYLNKPSSMIQ